jgi:hypothetical protein
MKSSFALPSCTYTISLSKEELQQLLETGLVSSVRPIQSVPCSTSRAVFDNKNKIFKPLDRKQIPNNLRFTLDENVADIEDGDWHVQFLNIRIEGFKKEKTDELV